MSVELMLTLICDRCGETTAEELTDHLSLVGDLVEDVIDRASWGWDPEGSGVLCDECLETALVQEQS